MELHLSPWDMVVQADLVVQAVMGGLVLASVLCWTVALAKGIELSGYSRRARMDLAALRRADGLDAVLSGPCRPLLGAVQPSVRRRARAVGPVPPRIDAAGTAPWLPVALAGHPAPTRS